MDFGISLDPLAVSQRHALYDDSESEEEAEAEREQLPPTLAEERPANAEFLTGRFLIIGLGSTASVFLKSFVCLRDTPSLSLPATEISAEEKRERFGGRGVQEISAVDFYEAADWVVCAHSKELRAEYSNRWAEKVFRVGKPSHVIAYVCRPLHEYFSAYPVDEDIAHVLRQLCSSSWPHPLGGVALESPNSVKGETASIMTHCELQGVPCSVHILYASSSLTETEKALCLLPSLQQTATNPTLARELPIRGQREGEAMVKKIQNKKPMELTNLYT